MPTQDNDHPGERGNIDWDELVTRVQASSSLDEQLALIDELKESAPPSVPEAELLVFLDQLWNHFRNIDLPAAGWPLLDTVVSAWLTTTYRQAKATGILVGQGTPDMAVANPRVALEHSI
jgi:hypothetical protein